MHQPFEMFISIGRSLARGLPICVALISTIMALHLSAADRYRMLLAPPVSGEARWLPRPLETRSGEIVDFNERLLVLKVDDQTLELDAARIVSISGPAANDAARRGEAAYRRGDYAAALGPLADAVKAGPPVWQQRILACRLIDAAARTGRHGVCFELLGNLVDSQPPTWVWRYAPIEWIGSSSDAEREQAALKALDDSRSMVRLVAASWLLSGARRVRAEQVLGEISQRDAEPVIARLADAVLWRTVPNPQIVSNWPKWERKLSSLSPALQAGPLACAAGRLQAAGQQALATAIWMELATQHSDIVPLAREAHSRVSTLLTRAGLEEDLHAWQVGSQVPAFDAP
jgi:hypothetical protein